MKVVAAAIATICLIGCTTHSNEDVRKADRVPAPAATSSLAGEDEIRPDCEEEWAGDYSMIANCVDRQTRGFRDVQRLVETHNIQDGDTTPEAKIFDACFREWRRDDHPDWTMIGHCFERQWDGYKRLNP